MFDCTRFAWRHVGLTGALVVGLLAGAAASAQTAAPQAASAAAVSGSSGKKMTKAVVPDLKKKKGVSSKGDDCGNVAGAPKPKIPKCPQDVANQVKSQ